MIASVMDKMIVLEARMRDPIVIWMIVEAQNLVVPMVVSKHLLGPCVPAPLARA